MRTKQIAFQFTGAEFVELVKQRRQLFALYPTEGDPLPAWRKARLINGKTRDKMVAAMEVLRELEDRNFNVTQVKRVIVWRGEDGKPGKVETYFHDFARR